MQEWQSLITKEVFEALKGTVITTAVAITVLALPAPYLAMRLIRRNRALVRNIWCEVAQADRFMQIWMAPQPLESVNEQYIWAFVPNGNPQAAHYSKIDEQLVQRKLIKIYEKRNPNTGDIQLLAERKSDLYYGFRNSVIFLLLLFLRITFFGDRVSHIAGGNSRYDEKKLSRLYSETTLLLSIFFICLPVLLTRYFCLWLEIL